MSEDERAQVLLQAIVAAKVDGRLGEAEQERLVAEMGGQLAPDETSFLREQLRQPPVLDHMARRLTTRADTVEVYAASLLAIDPARPCPATTWTCWPPGLASSAPLWTASRRRSPPAGDVGRGRSLQGSWTTPVVDA